MPHGIGPLGGTARACRGCSVLASEGRMGFAFRVTGPGTPGNPRRPCRWISEDPPAAPPKGSYRIVAMDIRIYMNRGNMLVQLSGRVVLDECDRIKTAILPRIGEQVSHISLDLSGVDFIDSAGLGVLVHLKSTAMKHRSRLALVAPSKVVYEILMVSKLDSIFEIITGAEATSLVSALAQPGFLQAGAVAAADPTLRATNQPAMPMAQARAAAPMADESASPKERIDQLCRGAVDFMRQGDYDSAAEAYRKALAIDPEYLPAHNNLAIVYEKKPQWRDEAVKAWERVLEISTARNDAKHIDRARKHLQTLGALR